MNASSLLPDLPAGARIVLVRLRSIGDVILLTPSLQMLKEWRPDLRVTVVVESRFRELLEGNPDIEELIEPGSGSGAAKIAARWRAIRALRQHSGHLGAYGRALPHGILIPGVVGAHRRSSDVVHAAARRFIPSTAFDASIGRMHSTSHA